MSTNCDPTTKPTLLIRLRDPGDRDAWQQFVDLYGPVLYRYCRYRRLDDNDAAEVMQEVLLQVLRSIESFEYDPERGRFRSWLGSIMRTKLVGYWREKCRSGIELVDEDAARIAGSSDARWNDICQEQISATAMACVESRMAADSWHAFRAVWFDRQSAEQVATAMNRSVAWVYVVKSRGLKLLREEVERLAEDLPWPNSLDA